MAQKAIGPTFPAELQAAGLFGLPFSWDAAGDITFGEAMTGAQIAAVDAVYAAHDPAKVLPATTLAQKIAAGLAVTSTGTPAISATYALDQTTLDQIQALAVDCAAGLGFPGGASSFAYPDLPGTPRTLTSANMIALYKALRDYTAQLNDTAATLAAGGTATWPSATATIA